MPLMANREPLNVANSSKGLVSLLRIEGPNARASADKAATTPAPAPVNERFRAA